MKVSRNWLQEYFESALPSVEELADVLTFHSFEIEEIIGTDVLDVKILPDRAADCLSHRGIAREIGAVLDVAVIGDSLREEIQPYPDSQLLEVTIDDEKKCLRYVGAVMQGVKVGPSPAWLKESLEAVGQRSINNVVDATNYVMLNIGQPLHAFDAANLTMEDGKYKIRVRDSKGDTSSDSSSTSGSEKITTLTGEEYTLTEATLLITDAVSDLPIGIAGVKGGKAAEITSATTDIIIESANFDGTLVRKASQRLKLWTDASQRFQNRPSPELAVYGMRDVLELIQQVAGGEVEGIVDVYPGQMDDANNYRTVSVSVAQINGLLGTSYTAGDVKNVFDRLAFSYEFEKGNETFLVIPPFERTDITITENLIEEVGRILGYENVTPEKLPQLDTVPDQTRFKGIERIKDFLTERGFTEISTQTFAVSGAINLANPLDQTRPALRTTFTENMSEAVARAIAFAPRVLGITDRISLFEIGTLFSPVNENLSLSLGFENLKKKADILYLKQVCEELETELQLSTITISTNLHATAQVILSDEQLLKLGQEYIPKQIQLGVFKSFTSYPFALRDIAVWTPERTEESEVAEVILGAFSENAAKDLQLARIDLFDRFSKEVNGTERISFAFRLVFESFDRTLSDADLNPLMDAITAALNAMESRGEKWEVR
jgi:phenylalanyl-tRNA synthetase beta chain